MRTSALAPLFFLSWAMIACANDCIELDERAGDLCGAHTVALETTGVHALPTVSASLGKKSLTLLLDTGASATVISASLLGRPDESYYRLRAPLCFGDGLCLENTLVYAWDTNLSGAAPEDIHGVVGMDVLQHFTFRLRRGTALSLEYEAHPCDGASVPMDYNDNGTPTVDALIDDLELMMLLDTGAAVCLLSDATAAALDSYFRENAVETEGCTAAGCTDTALSSPITRLCIGDACLESVDTKFPAWNAVGNTFFFAYDVAFDFPNDTLLFCEAAE